MAKMRTRREVMRFAAAGIAGCGPAPALSEGQQDDVAHSVRHLIEFGPALGFPHNSKVGSSRRCGHSAHSTHAALRSF